MTKYNFKYKSYREAQKAARRTLQILIVITLYVIKLFRQNWLAVIKYIEIYSF